MKAEAHESVIVACVGATGNAALLEAMARLNWRIIEGMTPRQMLKEIRRTRTSAVVVLWATDADDGLQLVKWLCGPPGGVAVIVAARAHSEGCEREVRAAGAGCYLPVRDDLGPLIQAVNDALGVAAPFAAGRARITQSTVHKPVLSLPPLVNPGWRASSPRRPSARGEARSENEHSHE